MAATYGPNDPQYSNSVGYRSASVANVGAGTGADVSEVSYNGFIFPPTHNSSISVIQEYDDHRRTVKFLTIALTVNAVITPVDADTPGTYQNTDEEMDTLEKDYLNRVSL